MSGQVLIVDDDVGFARALARRLRQVGHDVTTCPNGAEAIEYYAEEHFDVVVLDYQLPDWNGIELLNELKSSGVATTVFMLATAFAEVDIAVEAMRRGAFDFLSKGPGLEECIVRVERGVEVALLRKRMAEKSILRTGSKESDSLIGESAAVMRLRSRIAAVAASADTTVAIFGETGTGKGVIAQMVHAQSSRAFHPFVAVDCTTIPSTLMESELFGHDKGAFSGAVSAKEGMVEAADQGTLFIDEVGELPLAMQSKLLRLLEEREFTRVGSTRTRKLNARVIAATNRNLEEEVSLGRFRADLRYRLEVFLIETPPLRNLADDVFLLTAHFIRERSRALGKPEPRLDSKVIEHLQKYTFPGNVRELRNMVDQAVLLAQGDTLSLDEFPVLSRATMAWPAPQARAHQRVGAHSSPSLVPATSTTDPAASSPPPGRESQVTLPPSDDDSHPLGLQPNAEPATGSPLRSLQDIRNEAKHAKLHQVIAALEEHHGNVSAAARAVGRSRYQVLRILKRHGLR